MKVICIKPFSNGWINEECKSAPRPEVGDICEVVRVVDDKDANGYQYYVLNEFKGYRYRTDLFATLPEASADEMQEAQRESIVNIETAIV
jgi:hypothetical protein